MDLLSKDEKRKITLTVKELESLTGISQSTIYTMVREGQIPHIRVRNRIMFHKPTIEAWLSGDQSEKMNHA
jgi:excisionase family DNA binding protein